MSMHRQPTAEVLDFDRGVVARGGSRWCLHWYRDSFISGVWHYSECRCGRRRATRLYRNLDGVIDWNWLRGGA